MIERVKFSDIMFLTPQYDPRKNSSAIDIMKKLSDIRTGCWADETRSSSEDLLATKIEKNLYLVGKNYYIIMAASLYGYNELDIKIASLSSKMQGILESNVNQGLDTRFEKYFKRAQVAYKAYSRCAYCDVPLYYTAKEAAMHGINEMDWELNYRPTSDHIIPKALGGKGADNLVAACYFCNIRKGCSTENYKPKYRYSDLCNLTG